MNLGHAIEAIDDYDSELTIYIEAKSPVSAESEIVIDYDSDDGEPPPSAEGMSYLLEVHLARDAIRVWSEWRGGRFPTLEERVAAVLYYAENDAFLPVEN